MKIASLIDPSSKDGKPITTTSLQDQQKLMHASQRYSFNVEETEKQEKIAEDAVADAKMSLQKLNQA